MRTRKAPYTYAFYVVCLSVDDKKIFSITILELPYCLKQANEAIFSTHQVNHQK